LPKALFYIDFLFLAIIIKETYTIKQHWRGFQYEYRRTA